MRGHIFASTKLKCSLETVKIYSQPIKKRFKREHIWRTCVSQMIWPVTNARKQRNRVKLKLANNDLIRNYVLSSITHIRTAALPKRPHIQDYSVHDKRCNWFFNWFVVINARWGLPRRWNSAYAGSWNTKKLTINFKYLDVSIPAKYREKYSRLYHLRIRRRIS